MSEVSKVAKVADVSRRQFLKGTAMAGGGLVVGYSLLGCSEKPTKLMASEPGALAPNFFVEITPTGGFNFHCPRDEMGQGVTTGLTTLVAEELDVAPARFKTHIVGVNEAYNNPALFGQGTGGSTSIKVHYQPLRQMAANVRALLVEAASADLKVPASEIRTEDGQVLAGGKSYPYSDFIGTAATLALPEAAPMKERSEFRYIGHETPRLDAVEKSTGTATFGIDVDLPDMSYAAVLHSPVAGGKLKSFDAAAAKQMSGVTDVVETSLGLAVVAKSYWQARKAVGRLTAKWTKPELANYSSADVRARYEAAMANEEGSVAEEAGDLAAGFEAAEHTLEHKYWAPYLAHAPMEPMNATARVQNGKLEVWSGSQIPSLAHNLLVRHFGLDDDTVVIHNFYSGGGFGRRTYLSHVVEAAEVATLTKKTVKLIWSREDDMRDGHYRPASLMSIKAGINAAGEVVGWRAKRVGNNAVADSLNTIASAALGSGVPKFIVNAVSDTAESVLVGMFVDPSSVEGFASDYDFANKAAVHVTVDDGLPLGFWRSVGHSFSAFAKESALDELAHARGIDPVKLRLDNTKNNPRLQGVIKAVQSRLGSLGKKRGRYVGFAAHGSFSSYVAEAAEVSVTGDTIRVHKVICAVDCGQPVNPDNIRMQMEGAIMFGLTAALYGEIGLKDGAVEQSNFHDYKILRMNEAPDVEVIVIDSDEAPTGVGEPGLPPIAPAVANAVFAATGKRLRELPLSLT